METSETKQNKAASVIIQTAIILGSCLTVYAAGVVLFILPSDMI